MITIGHPTFDSITELDHELLNMKNTDQSRITPRSEIGLLLGHPASPESNNLTTKGMS